MHFSVVFGMRPCARCMSAWQEKERGGEPDLEVPPSLIVCVKSSCNTLEFIDSHVW